MSPFVAITAFMQCEIQTLHEHHNVNIQYIKNTKINDYSNPWILLSLKIHFDILLLWSTDSATICVINGARHIEIVFITSSKIFLIHYYVAKEHIKNIIRRIHIYIYMLYTVYVYSETKYIYFTPRLNHRIYSEHFVWSITGHNS